MPAKREIAPELLAEARRLYEQTLAPVDDITALLRINKDRFYLIVRREGWRKRRARVATFEFSKVLGAATAGVMVQSSLPGALQAAGQPMLPEQRVAIAERLMSATEEALDAIKRISARLQPATSAEADANARTMANVSRSLREIAVFIKPDEVKAADDADDDPVPRDIDEFRYELARRIRSFIEARSAGAAGVSAVPEGKLA
jgi:hypothetical protein